MRGTGSTFTLLARSSISGRQPYHQRPVPRYRPNFHPPRLFERQRPSTISATTGDSRNQLLFAIFAGPSQRMTLVAGGHSIALPLPPPPPPPSKPRRKSEPVECAPAFRCGLRFFEKPQPGIFARTIRQYYANEANDAPSLPNGNSQDGNKSNGIHKMRSESCGGAKPQTRRQTPFNHSNSLYFNAIKR